MAAMEVHISLPAFSRLCLFCNAYNTAPHLAGGPEAVLSDSATLRELQYRFSGIEDELPLVSGVCTTCQCQLLHCQQLLVQFHAAADALAASYQQAAAGRQGCRVLLRLGQQHSEASYSTCCQLAAGHPPLTHPAELVRHLVTEAFGAESMEGRLVVSTSLPPRLTKADPGSVTRSADGAEGADQESEGLEDWHGKAMGGGDGGLSDTTRTADTVVRQADGAAANRRTPADSHCAAANGPVRRSPDPGGGSPPGSGRTEPPAVAARGSPERGASPPSPSPEEPEEEDWSGGRRRRRLRGRAAAPAGRDLQPLTATSPADRPPRPSGTGSTRRRPQNCRPCCHVCRQTFRSERSLQAHVEKLHSVARPAEPEQAVRVWCPACSALLAPADVTGHVVQQHGGRLECTCCGLTLEGAAGAARHCADRHTANYMCIVCLQMYSEREQLIGHMSSSHGPDAGGGSDPPTDSDPVSAVYSDLVRRLRGRARRLQLSVLGRTAVRCPYCGQTCSLHYLRTHLYKHRAADFRCHACEKRFKFPVSFQRHLLLHAGRADKCPQCEAVFSSRASLLSHLRTHSSERQFGCDRCQKRFKFKQTRDAHILRAHGGGASKVCDVCGAEFRLQYQLTVHLARHRSGRTLRCPLCPRLYELNLDLKRHLYSKHKLRVAEVERRFPEIRLRPNTGLGPTGAAQPAGPDPGSGGGPCPDPAPDPTAAEAGYLSADDPPPADLFLAGAGRAADRVQPAAGRLLTVPPDLLSDQPLADTTAAAAAAEAEAVGRGAGQMLLVVDGADVGMIMQDVLPPSSAAF